VNVKNSISWFWRIYWCVFFNGSSAHSGSRPLIQFRNHFSQTVGPLGRVISPSEGRYIRKGQHKHRINTYTANIHVLSGIQTHDPSVRASEDSSCLRPCGCCEWHLFSVPLNKKKVVLCHVCLYKYVCVPFASSWMVGHIFFVFSI
jgi:hypothetical protein